MRTWCTIHTHFHPLLPSIGHLIDILIKDRPVHTIYLWQYILKKNKKFWSHALSYANSNCKAAYIMHEEFLTWNSLLLSELRMIEVRLLTLIKDV